MDFYLSNFETRGPLFSSSVDEFAVFFDVPEAIRMNFQTTGSTGRISVGSGASVLGNFEFGTTHRLSISLEVSAKTWSATLDDSPLLMDAAFNAGENPVLSSVRINLADDGLLANAPVAYIDNIRLEAVPEPKPVQLALVGGALLMLLRNCRRTAAHRAALRPGFSAKTN
jgi:hypothetical protein